jgi:cytochrome P450
MTSTEIARKVERGDTAVGCPVEHGADGVWRIRGHTAGSTLLRSTQTRQAGLGVENSESLPKSFRRPVLYRDGPEHREHRRQTAKYFTPRRVDEHYRDLMHSATERALTRLRQNGAADLSTLSFQVAVEVAAAVIGLTNSRPGLDRRLNLFFPDNPGQPGYRSLRGLYWTARRLYIMASIYFLDVRPAARVRRKARRDDLISHLIDEGCTNLDILGECVTFGAAGMITTREFINVAAWHLFQDEALRARYLEADEPERFDVLHELLRIEPVVGNLKRRTTAPVEVPGED